MSASTGGAVARGVAWMLLARIADRVGGIASIAVTARFLSPDDFGTFQMALSVVVIVELFSAFGFEWALMRHPNPQRVHYDTAFTLQIMVSAIAALLVLVMAQPFAAYYRKPDLVLPIVAMAFLPLVHGVNNLAVAHLRRELRFEADFWRMFVPRILSLATSVVLAIWLQSYWALIAGVAIAKLSSTAMGYILHSYRPRLGLAAWRELLGFSVWMQMSNIIEGLRLRIGDLIIGRMLGSHPLAILNMSSELATLPQSEFVGAVNSAVFPKYSRMQDDTVQLRAAYSDILSLTLLVGLPAACGLIFTAPLGIRVLLGPQWMEAAGIVQLVATGALANAICANTPYVLMTANRPNLNTGLAAINFITLVSLLVGLTNAWGLEGAAIGFTIAALSALPLHFVVLRFVIGLDIADIWPRVWRSVAAALIMSTALSLFPAASPLDSIASSLLHLAAMIGAGALVYCGVIAALWFLSGKPNSIEWLLLNAVIDVAWRAMGRLKRGATARST